MSETSDARERFVRLFGQHHGFYASYSELAQTWRRGPPPGTFVVAGTPTTSTSYDAGEFICNTITYGRPLMTTTDQPAPEAAPDESAYAGPADFLNFGHFMSSMGLSVADIFGPPPETSAPSELVLLKITGLPLLEALDLIRKPMRQSIDDGVGVTHVKYDGKTLSLVIEPEVDDDQPQTFSFPMGVMVVGQEDPVSEMASIMAVTSILATLDEEDGASLAELADLLPGAPPALYDSVIGVMLEEGLVTHKADDNEYEITLRGKIILALTRVYDDEAKTLEEIADTVGVVEDDQLVKVLGSLKESEAVVEEDGRWRINRTSTFEPVPEPQAEAPAAAE